ncbi:MAG: tol-pal system protein YbgF [Pseudomonadota bacterium]
MSLNRHFALLAGVAIIATSATAQEERLSRRELTTETYRLQSSVTDIEDRTLTLQRQNADLALKVRDLEAEKAQLVGRVETLQFQLSQNREEMNRMAADDEEIGRRLELLDQQVGVLNRIIAEQNRLILDGQLVEGAGENLLSALSQGGAGGIGGAGTDLALSGSGDVANQVSGAATQGAAGGSLGTIAASDLPGEAGPLFADAKARLLRFDYAGAERSFRAFLDNFGDDPQAGEAQYWLGEVLYQQQNYNESGSAYRDMIQKYPDDARAPDALVKLGRSLRLVGQTDRACQILDTLGTRYPNASPVTLNLANVERSRSNCG